MTDHAEGDRVEKHSILHHAAADCAAEKHLDWERLSYDIQETASEHWRRRFWRLWFRRHWVEHILGQTFWLEMGDENFGMLQPTQRHNPVLVDCVADRLIIGWENLGIILWASDWGLDLDEVIQILKKLNINHVRVNNRRIEDFWEPLLTLQP